MASLFRGIMGKASGPWLLRQLSAFCDCIGEWIVLMSWMHVSTEVQGMSLISEIDQ